jgi:uncharacterized membrane protein
MSIIALDYIISGIIVIAVSLPLIKRKIKMNTFYGFRIKAAFESEQLWYDINAYGGRMLIRFGSVILIAGLIGISLPRKFWLIYAFASLAVILVGLFITVFKALRYAAQLKKPR